MSHFKVLCKSCDRVLGQCRCASPGKEIRRGELLCKECLIKSLRKMEDHPEGDPDKS